MIETARKEDLFLDKKLIIPENRLDAIRIMARLHPVVGDQPTNEKDQPNTNNPVLDLACTILNIHESGIGVHADLRKIQNEPPKYFYGKGFMSGISSLKGNGILAVYGQWRDASGHYSIKQFYYTDKEILWRNAISDTAWSAWFNVLTGNSDLDYNKLLNVPITSTLSDSKTQIASIFAVNNVNRAAVNAQKTANTANANAVDAMSEAKKKVEPKDVKSESLKDSGRYYSPNSIIPKLKAGDSGLALASGFLENNEGLDFKGLANNFIHYYVQSNFSNVTARLVAFFNGYGTSEWYVSSTDADGVWSKPARFYSNINTSISENGFLRAFGRYEPLTTDSLTSLVWYIDTYENLLKINKKDIQYGQRADLANGLSYTFQSDNIWHPIGQMKLENSGSTSEESLVDWANFSDRNRRAFVIHHYNDREMAVWDNVGENNVFLLMRNARNPVRRPDKANNFIGSGDFIRCQNLIETNTDKYMSVNVFELKQNGDFVWGHKASQTKSIEFKNEQISLNDYSYKFRNKHYNPRVAQFYVSDDVAAFTIDSFNNTLKLSTNSKFTQTIFEAGANYILKSDGITTFDGDGKNYSVRGRSGEYAQILRALRLVDKPETPNSPGVVGEMVIDGAARILYACYSPDKWATVPLDTEWEETKKWVDVTINRLANTQYKNNSKSPIYLWITGTGPSNDSHNGIVIDGVLLNDFSWGKEKTIYIQILPNSTYELKDIGVKEWKERG